MIRKWLSIIMLVCGAGVIGFMLVQTESSNSSSDNKGINNYTPYLNKIWVVDSWDSGAYDYASFFISKVDKETIEGKFSTRSIAKPNFYFYSLTPSKYLGTLTGSVNQNSVEGHFIDKVGNKGNVTLILKQEDKIEATIAYTDKRPIYKDVPLDGTFSFRPYHLTDLENFTLHEAHSFEVHLNFWGSVHLVCGQIDTGNKVHPVAYLTDEDDNILYVLNGSFKTGSEIFDAEIKDIDNDGLKDVTIMTRFIQSDRESLGFVFFQKDNGRFYHEDFN